MSDQMDPLKFAAMICDLERGMTELLALRRAICLLNAERSRPHGPRYPRRRRRASISSMQNSESVARFRYHESDQSRIARLPPTKPGDSSGGVRSSQALPGRSMPGRRGTTEDEMEFP